MKRDKVVIALFIILILAAALQILVISNLLNKHRPVVGQAVSETFQARFCVNHEPTILGGICDDDVSVRMNRIEWDCQINASDMDNNSMYVDFYSNEVGIGRVVNSTVGTYSKFNFTAWANLTGNYTFYANVFDTSGCYNMVQTLQFTKMVAGVCFFPEILANFTSKTMYNDDVSVLFDLDNYFSNTRNIVDTRITYSLLSPPQNFVISFDANNEMTFDPVNTFTGTEYFTIVADTYCRRNVTSNTFNVTVRSRNPPPPSSASTSGGGGGSYNQEIPMCMPIWYCEEWGACLPEGIMTRQCIDRNNCNTTFGKPNTTMACQFISTCYDGFKGPGEVGVDCGGDCPPCGNCYDMVCNNEEDCTKGLTTVPDCGGTCQACIYKKESCFDSICNNGEDCTHGMTEIPDCGGPCNACPETDMPLKAKFNWGLLILFIIIGAILIYIADRTYPLIVAYLKRRKRKMYEDRLLLETKITESILESLKSIEAMLGKEDIQKIIVLFSILVRKYFKSLFRLKYEFTYEEILKEIASKSISSTYKNVLKAFFEHSGDIEFSGKNVSVEEMKAMISEFRHMLSLSSLAPLKTEDKVLGSITGSRVDRIFIMISRSETFLQTRKINFAYDLYVQILKEYPKLAEEDKVRVNNFVSRLYEEIKLAREEIELGKNL